MKTIKEVVENQRRFFNQGKTLDVAFRMKQLQKLRRMIQSHEQDLLDALKEDLNKPKFEAYGTEIGLVLDEAKYVLKHLKRWAVPGRVRTSIVNFPSSSRIFPEPFGVSLILSPWNYPVLLTLDPLIGAIAAGNCAVLKPSNYSPAVSAVICRMIEETYPSEYIAVVEGGRMENQALLEEKFDMVFFTGSMEVGKQVMKAASRHLTPVCLELGGKSPCIVDETADLNLAAKRIVWGKFLNAGQTCVAPDYLLVQEQVKDALLKRIRFYIRKYYTSASGYPDSFPKIVNEKHFQRLMGLMESGTIAAGGDFDPGARRISPTVLDSVNWDSPIMQEEIFGPILPVLTYRDFREAIRLVQSRPKPLAAYLFTTDKRQEAWFLTHLSFGGGCINDTVMHLVSSHMPFGGVGNSGMGGYHGKDSFDTFSHKKSILKKSRRIDLPFRYPPYRELYYKIMKFLLK